MARKRDPRRDKAKKIWLESNGEKQLKDIADKLNVSDSQVRKWKSIDKWSAELKGNVTIGKSNVTNQGGAPFGNQNARGNKGNSRASPPIGNKNALKTGEYETIFFDTLSDEEKDIYSSLNDDPSFVLSEEIRLLKIRQLRMMKRIKEAESGLNDEEIDRLQSGVQVFPQTHWNVVEGKPETIKGDKGDPGQAATITVGTVTSGSTASVTNVGTSSAARFNFVLPKGDKGDPGTNATMTSVATTAANGLMSK